MRKLSVRELQILQLLAEGKSNREIAVLLNLSPHTIKTHVSGIMSKFGVSDRVQVAVYAFRNGLI
jgi:two-component system, NarL family, response regulator LiaR